MWKRSIPNGVSRGRVWGFRPPPPPPPPPPLLTDLTLVWGWNSYIGRIVYHFLTGWFFLIKSALHFATKQNSRDIQKYNCFWVPSYDLFASAPKAVFSAPTAIGVYRLIENCVVVSAFSAGHKKAKQSILYQNLDLPLPAPSPPNKKFLNPPLIPPQELCERFFLN